MRKIYPAFTYGDGPRAGCWWDETVDIPDFPKAQCELRTDVVVVGGGFTGVSAALHLAETGADVVLVEASRMAWGASGRNGGFCCLGGARTTDTALDREFGREGRQDWYAAEVAAVDLVDDLLQTHGIDADRHSQGETLLAHNAKNLPELESYARKVEENYGLTPRMTTAEDLPGEGLSGPFHGAVTVPKGFALNPRKYLAGLIRAATARGVRLFEHSPAVDIASGQVKTPSGTIKADTVIVATNGYSSEDVPDWLAGRYMPTQSTIVVTRPLTGEELQSAGWTSYQMVYDTRNLLHYFRLMPDNRMLFGMRGGLLSSPASEARAQARVHRDFEQMFPMWAHVERPNSWSGLVCLARDGLPFTGEVPGQPGVFAGMCYHGNGVAMGSYTGKLLAELAQGQTPDLYPAAMQRPLPRFPLGRGRRALMPFVYAGLALGDL